MVVLPVLASSASIRAASLFFAMLTVVAQLVTVVVAILWLTARRFPTASRGLVAVRAAIGPSALWLATGVALVCTLGSLYLSEIAGFVPCTLCWYQRIGMYPLVVLLAVAALRRTPQVARATLPLIGIASAISVYHYALERFPSLESAATCDPSAPCSVVWIWRFHYISIPLMALSGFALIATLVVLSTHVGDRGTEGGRRAVGEQAQGS
jgi:disulfide bond formation protein DsbB